MDFSHLLLSSIPQNEKLLEYGFCLQGDVFVLKKNLDDEFYAVVEFGAKSLNVQVFENETDEKYALLDVKKARGAFVNGIRSKVSDLVYDIAENCFICEDLKSQYVDWLESDLKTKGDYPWEGEENYAVYRCSNSKWFALVMQIKFKNLGFESEEPVWVVNLKADAEKIPALVDKKSIFPAWHMNKKYWITVVLTAVTDFEKLKELTLMSKQLVENQKK